MMTKVYQPMWPWRRSPSNKRTVLEYASGWFVYSLSWQPCCADTAASAMGVSSSSVWMLQETTGPQKRWEGKGSSATRRDSSSDGRGGYESHMG